MGQNPKFYKEVTVLTFKFNDLLFPYLCNRNKKEPKCPSTDEWIKKMWFIYTMEYYLAMRKNEIWPFAAMWMELEGIMLSVIRERHIKCFHSYVELEKLNRRPWRKGRGKTM